MLSARHKIARPGRAMVLGFAALALLLLSGYALGGCAGLPGMGVVPLSQGQTGTPTPGATDPTPPLLPTPQPTSPLPPGPEPTGPRIPTPVPTLPPTFPPPPPSPTRLPTSPPLPTLTAGPPILLTYPLPDPKQAGVEWFASTGHTLRGAFLEYWNKNGGVAQFGLPRTEEFVEARGPDLKPVRVQYFERAIFESDPEIKSGEVMAQSGEVGFGAEKLREKGYDAGAYPRYGRAADFSWISGQMQLNLPTICMRPECGCSLVLYEGSNTRVQLDGRIWRLLSEFYYAPVANEEYLTIFGQLASPGQVENHCSIEKDTMQVYVVEDMQANRVP